MVVAFFVALGFGIVAPDLPLFATAFHVGKTEAAAVISAFALMRIAGAFPAGRLIDRVGERIVLRPTGHVSFGTIAHTLFYRYRRRAVLGLVLIGSQALFYNGISFTFPLVLTHW